MTPSRATREDIPLLKKGLQQLFDYHLQITGDEKYRVSISDEYIERTMGTMEYFVLGNSFIRGKGDKILDLWVPEEDRNKGYATTLVREYVKGKEAVSTLVDPRNELAMEFWKSFPEIRVDND